MAKAVLMDDGTTVFVGRPTEEQARARDTVFSDEQLEDWVKRMLPKAMGGVERIFADPKASAAALKGASDMVISLHKDFYKRRKSATVTTIDDADSENLKKQAEENGGFPKLDTAFHG